MRKMVAGIFALVIVITIFASCSTNISESPPTQARPNTEKTILRLACYYPDGFIIKAVYDFNRTNNDFEIEIVDYSQYPDIVTRLNTEIIAGNAPDMFAWGFGVLNPLDSGVYGQAGTLMNLYEFIDNDNDISRSIFLGNLLSSLENSDGALYEMPTEFVLRLFAGKTEVLGSKQGWTFEDYFDLLERFPDSTLPFGTLSWVEFFRLSVGNNYAIFLDWNKGECYFESEEFLRILEMGKTYYTAPIESILPIKLVMSDQQLLSSNGIGNVSSIQKFTALFGDEINYIGFPTSAGVGNCFIIRNSLSISSSSRHQDICWQFLKGLISFEAQMENVLVFPVNYEALSERVFNAPLYEEAGASLSYIDGDGDRWSVTFEDASPEESEAVMQLIESCDRVYRENRYILSIIEEEAPAYFSGIRTAEEAAHMIQSRVQIYMSEQSR